MSDTKELKKNLKIVAYRLIGGLIPIIIFAIYLTIFNLWRDFLDYAVFGIKTFSNIFPFYLLFFNSSFLVKVLAGLYLFQMGVMITVYMISFKKKSLQETKWFDNLVLLFVYSVMTSVVMIPIADKIHFAIGNTPVIIAFIYCIYEIIKSYTGDKPKKIAKIYIDVLSKIIFFIAICYSVAVLIASFKSEELRKDIKHFRYNRIDNEIYKRVVEVTDFIKEEEKKGKEVHELDMLSAIYSISLDKYYKDYDMFNLGNFGTKGTKGIIEDLEKKENLIILLKQQKYKTNWQYPQEVADYVRGNFKKVRRNKYI